MKIKEEIKERIVRAAEALKEKGLPLNKITNDAVREEMGGKGSMTHISPVMREWKETQRIGSQTIDDMPVAFKDALMRLGIQVLSLANTEASKKIAVIQTAADETIQQIQLENGELLSEIEKLENDNETLKGKVKEKIGVETKLSAALAATEKEVAILSAKLESKEEKIKELKVQIESARIREDKAHDQIVLISNQYAQIIKEKDSSKAGKKKE